jgi:hypothetical protein
MEPHQIPEKPTRGTQTSATEKKRRKIKEEGGRMGRIRPRKPNKEDDPKEIEAH